MLGEVIHGYRVDQALSSDKGGFADVYFASHVESGAEAVVKVLKPEMSALHDIVQRFFNEARAAASVHHPGIVAIHNVGYHADRAYLLMERLHGDDLETRLTQGPVPLDRAIIFVRQTAGAIGAAHDRGIVHRDLKPANLFVVADPDVVGGERVKVLDFGIAKLTVDATAGKTMGVFGTPAYMSPEQCSSSGAVDGRADLYSLGCIFYELVCGRPPFGHGGTELIAAHLRDAPPPLSAIAPWVPMAIEQVIMCLLAKQPGERFPTCAALIAALDAAAAASGLAAGTSQLAVPQMGLAGGGSQPHVPTGMLRTPHPSTLMSAAGAVSRTQPPSPSQRRGLWLALGALVVVGGAVAALTVAGSRHPVVDPPLAPGDAGVAVVPVDAARVAVVADAAIAVTPPDAAVIASTDVDTGDSDAGSGSAVVDRNHERAKQLIHQANQLLKRSPSPALYQRARKLYSESYALYPDPAAMFNVALMDLQLSQLDDARTAVQTVIAASPQQPLAGKAQRLLERIDREARRGSDNAGSDSADNTGSGSAATADPAAQVASLNDQADKAFINHHYDESLSLFRRANDLQPSPTSLVGVCSSEKYLGHCKEARRVCQSVMAIWPHTPAAALAESMLGSLSTCTE